MKVLLVLLTLLSAAVFALAACSPAAPPETAPPARPTVTSIPVFQYVVPTQPPRLATVAALTAVAQVSTDSLDPQKVERGRDRYVALDCNTCHGENGEGTEEGSALTLLTLSEADFISFMRSGGELGAAHQYAADRLSQSGAINLYQYLQSVAE